MKSVRKSLFLFPYLVHQYYLQKNEGHNQTYDAQYIWNYNNNSMHKKENIVIVIVNNTITLR